MDDLVFISGDFFDYEIPKEKKFLLKYFKTPLELQFVKYYLCFKNIDNFVDHTGFFCQRRWLLLLKKRIEYFLKEQSTAKSDFDLSKLVDIEQGNIKIGDV